MENTNMKSFDKFFEDKEVTGNKVDEQLTQEEDDARSKEYYTDQLAKIDPKDEYGVKFVISDSKDKTKYLQLNKISKDVLIDWINKNF